MRRAHHTIVPARRAISDVPKQPAQVDWFLRQPARSTPGTDAKQIGDQAGQLNVGLFQK